VAYDILGDRVCTYMYPSSMTPEHIGDGEIIDHTREYYIPLFQDAWDRLQHLFSVSHTIHKESQCQKY
jgi:hypothetical protein